VLNQKLSFIFANTQFDFCWSFFFILNETTFRFITKIESGKIVTKFSAVNFSLDSEISLCKQNFYSKIYILVIFNFFHIPEFSFSIYFLTSFFLISNGILMFVIFYERRRGSWVVEVDMIHFSWYILDCMIYSWIMSMYFFYHVVS
jgi:hypothetical protein